MTPEMMGTMAEIAKESRKTPEAIAREMGKDMKDANAASIRDGVAVLKVSGPLFRYANLMTRICGATSYELLARDFNKALQHPEVKAILFDIDSPGGEVNGCSELADMIFLARGKKPIVAYASGACCSGALPPPATRFWLPIRRCLVLSGWFLFLNRMMTAKQ